MTRSRHVGAFFNSPDEEYKSLMPFISEGFACGTNVYLHDGKFDQDQMVETFERLASGSTDSPYPLSRIVCQMDWATQRESDLRHLIEFEARINDVWQRHEDVVVCICDAARLSGEAVVDIIRTHPVVVLGGRAHENSFYLPPAEFLEQTGMKASPGRSLGNGRVI
ncbi:hypothetical protein J2W42_004369 [Rhizobium tibeticum]|nr:hypothetical protein [Rhizobium tibeticum]